MTGIESARCVRWRDDDFEAGTFAIGQSVCQWTTYSPGKGMTTFNPLFDYPSNSLTFLRISMPVQRPPSVAGDLRVIKLKIERCVSY